MCGARPDARLGAFAVDADAVETRQGPACFLLHEIGVGEILRAPADACRTRVAPASTFKVPHALAALDAGVIDGPDARIAYDGRELSVPSWRRDHTLRTAMRDSVVWYFQALAERLGEAREREYLQKFNYGNKDSSSGLTTFWLGGSLLISPEEQVRFLQDLYAGALPVEKRHLGTVRAILVQPRGQVTNASGAHAFGEWAPEPSCRPRPAALRIEPASRSDGSLATSREAGAHAIFASLVTGASGVPPLAAVDQAATALTRARVLAAVGGGTVHPALIRRLEREASSTIIGPAIMRLGEAGRTGAHAASSRSVSRTTSEGGATARAESPKPRIQASRPQSMTTSSARRTPPAGLSVSCWLGCQSRSRM